MILTNRVVIRSSLILVACFLSLISASCMYASTGDLLVPDAVNWVDPETVGLSSAASQGFCNGFGVAIVKLNATYVAVAGSFDTWLPSEPGTLYRDIFIYNIAGNVKDVYTADPINNLHGLNSIATNHSRLFMGGLYDMYGTNNIGELDAFANFTGTPLKLDNDYYPNAEVLNIAVHGNNVHISGAFNQLISITGRPPIPTQYAVFNDVSKGYTLGVPGHPIAPTVLVVDPVTNILWAADYYPNNNTAAIMYLMPNVSYWVRWNESPELIRGTITDLWVSAQYGLFIGGDFGAIGTQDVGDVAWFTNGAWNPMTSPTWGPGVSYGILRGSLVYALWMEGPDLYVGGMFTQPYNAIARYNVITQEWYEVGGGFYGVVSDILMLNSSLYVTVWQYSHPASASASNPLSNLLLAGGILVLVLFGVTGFYFWYTSRNGLKYEWQKVVSQRGNSYILLISVWVAGSLQASYPRQIFAVASLPGLDIEQAKQWIFYSSVTQWCFAFASPFVAGYLGNRIRARFTVSVGLLAGSLSALVFMFFKDFFVLCLHGIFVGVAYGMVFTSALVYHAHTTDVSSTVLPLLALFFFNGTFPDLLNSLTTAMLSEGYLKPDFVTLNVFHMIISILLIPICWYGLAQDPIDPDLVPSLREQLRVNWKAILPLLLFYMIVQFVTGSAVHTTLSLETLDTAYALAYPIVGFVLSAALLSLIYLLYLKWPVGARKVALLGLCILIVGFIIMICALMIPSQPNVESIVYLFGNKIEYASSNLLLAVMTSLFIGQLVTHGSGLLLGIYAGFGFAMQGVATFIESEIIIEQFFNNPSAQGFILLGLLGAVFLMMLVFIKLEPEFAPRFVLPSMGVKARPLNEALLDRATAPIESQMVSPVDVRIQASMSYISNTPLSTSHNKHASLGRNHSTKNIDYHAMD